MIEAMNEEIVDARELIKSLRLQNAALRGRCDNLTTATKDTLKLFLRKNEEMIRTKAKKAKTSSDELKCEFPECINHDKDALIKCNACVKLI